MAAMKFREPNRARWIGSRPAHDGDQVAVSGSANNATVIVYTVPAGKTLFLTGYTWGMYFGITNRWAYALVRNVADVLQYYLIYVRSNAIECSSGGLSLTHPLEIPAGFDVVVFGSGADAQCDLFIHGWIENA